MATTKPTHEAPIDSGSPAVKPARGPLTAPSDVRGEAEASRWPWVEGSPGKLALAVIFGVVFGFLLQKGGVAKFDILIGALLLENFVVAKVMLTPIVVGRIGVYLLERAGRGELKIKETVYGANILGGLIFGLGFALLAYCPGTDAAAVGQGNLDALVGVLGLIFGSYLFALASNFTGGTITTWGKRGKITLPEQAGVSRGLFIAFAAPVLVAVLVLLEVFVG